jgi:hypothetical protein
MLHNDHWMAPNSNMDVKTYVWLISSYEPCKKSFLKTVGVDVKILHKMFLADFNIAFKFWCNFLSVLYKFEEFCYECVTN